MKHTPKKVLFTFFAINDMLIALTNIIDVFTCTSIVKRIILIALALVFVWAAWSSTKIVVYDL